MNRRTKIIATIGPACDSPEILEHMIEAGMNCGRINFSHGVDLAQAERIARLKAAAQKTGRYVSVLADLPGPKMRVLNTAPIVLNKGVEICFARKRGSGQGVPISHPEALAQIKEGQRILLDDGRIVLSVKSATDECIVAVVDIGGELLPHKGLNLPDTELDLPHVTSEDEDALDMAVRMEADWIALSFVRGPEAAAALREALSKRSAEMPILAKIERPEALSLLPQVIAAFDGVMVARGDLGVEVPLERVPLIQKDIVEEANRQAKPVIIATEMLESMRFNPRPTRAETADVANAVWEGADAVMLSAETASGKWPIESVRFMDLISRETELHLLEKNILLSKRIAGDPENIEQSMAHAACSMAEEIDASAIVVPSFTGTTARFVSKFRPSVPILASCVEEKIARRLSLFRGVDSIIMPEEEARRDLLSASIRSAVKTGILEEGMRVVTVSGRPGAGSTRNPTIQIITIREDFK